VERSYPDTMARAKTIFLIAVFISVAAIQLVVLYRQPFWGLYSSFPFTLLREIELPVIIAVGAALVAVFTKSTKEQQLLYSIIATAIVEIIVIRIMVRMEYPDLVFVVLLSNAFITVQFLRIACDDFVINIKSLLL
jgi:hypothetical protein